MVIMERLRTALIRSQRFLMIGMLALMLFLVVFEVFIRFMFNIGLFWSEELCRYLFIWVILIGTVLGLEKGKHFRVSFLVENYFSARGKKVIFLIGNILVAMFIVSYLYYGILFCVHVKTQISATLRIPMAVIYSGMSISAFLMLVHLGLKVILKNSDSTGRE